MGFFGILTVFYGLPIYIIRDLFMTTRSFVKRVHDYQKYQSATRNMHALYPDATAEELAADNTCIVCREEMHPWQGGARNADNPDGATPRVVSERQRPKKLPCGHILHFACLRSWLERQQACPTCRRSVLEPPDQRVTGTDNRRGRNGARGAQADGNQADRRNNDANRRPRRRNYFRFRLGDLRVVIGANRVAAGEDPAQAVQNAVHDAELPHDQDPPSPDGEARQQDPPAEGDGDADAAEGGSTHLRAPWRAMAVHAQLSAIEEVLAQDIRAANIAMERAGRIRALQAELSRLAEVHEQTLDVPLRPTSTVGPAAGPSTAVPGIPENLVLPDGWRLVPLFAAPPPPPAAGDGANQAPTAYPYLPYVRTTRGDTTTGTPAARDPLQEALATGAVTLPPFAPMASRPPRAPGPNQLYVMPSGEVVTGLPPHRVPGAPMPSAGGVVPQQAATGTGTPAGIRSAAATPPPQQLFNAQQQMAHALQVHEHNIARMMQQQQVRMGALRAAQQQAAGQTAAENGRMTPPVGWMPPAARGAQMPWNPQAWPPAGLAQRENAPQNPETSGAPASAPANSGGPSAAIVAPTPTAPVAAAGPAAVTEPVAPREPVTGNGSAVASGSVPLTASAEAADPKQSGPSAGTSSWSFESIEPEASSSTHQPQNGSASQASARAKQPTVEDSEDAD
jgi:hypothetical protein